jgi:hypothetical protein
VEIGKLTGMEGIKAMGRKAILVFIVIIGLSGSIFAQIDKQITAIRAEVAAIDKAAKGYKKRSKDVMGLSTEGAAATYFTSGKGLKKITAKIYGETYNGSAELYYKGGEVIFIFWKMNKYDTTIGMDPPPKVIRVEEERYYFAGGKLIRLLAGKTEIKPGDENYTEMKDGIMELEKGLKEAR